MSYFSENPVTTFTDERFIWLNDPTSWNVSDKATPSEKGYGGKYEVTSDQLILTPPSKKDFWRRTFYKPTMIKGDASAMVVNVPADKESTIDISFSFNPVSQFDQAGVLVWLDKSHWLKTGLEFADGVARLSCVCTNVYSDWSVMPWKGTAAKIRVHKIMHNSSVVIEAAYPDTEDWQFVRICHLSALASHHNLPEEKEASGSKEEKPWAVGPYAACSLEQRGMSAVFNNLTIKDRIQATHEAEGIEFGEE